MGRPRPSSVSDTVTLSVPKLLWGYCASSYPYCLISLTTGQEDILWIADYKAIKHILHKSGYDYPKPPYDKPLRAMVTDQGLAWADGKPFHSTRAHSMLKLRQVKHTGDSRRFCYRHSGFPRQKRSYLCSPTLSLELALSLLYAPLHLISSFSWQIAGRTSLRKRTRQGPSMSWMGS